MYILKEYIYGLTPDGISELKDVDVILSEDKESLVRYIMNETGDKDAWDYMRSSNTYKDAYHNKKYVIEEQ